MKKLAAFAAILALASAPAFAANQGGFSGPSSTTTTQTGGFTGPSGTVTTAANAKSMRDDTWVTLRGNITERVSDDLYIFKDSSGTINVVHLYYNHSINEEDGRRLRTALFKAIGQPLVIWIPVIM